MTDADQNKPNGETPNADQHSSVSESAAVNAETPAVPAETPALQAEASTPPAETPASPAEPPAEVTSPDAEIPAASVPPETPASAPEEPAAAPPVRAAKKALLYAAAAIGIGALAGAVIGAISLREMRVIPAPAPVVEEHPGLPRELLDLGSAESTETGLKGHLTTQWTAAPVYSVTIAPGDPAQFEGFAASVNDPPRPLSIKIQLKDRLGFVMCSQDVLLKYQARKPADLEAADSAKDSGKNLKPKKISAKDAERLKTEQDEFDKQQAQEAQREHGRDVFQNKVGQGGQVESISAKGEIPCTMESFERVAAWGFVPNFPTLDEQANLISIQPKAQQAAMRASAEKARRRVVSKSPTEALSFSFEGDDAVVDFDVSGGVLETKAGKTFIIDNNGGQDNTARWQEYPAYFHYRCEQTTSSCVLARSGASVMHAKLKR
jgi:hypothetical protein